MARITDNGLMRGLSRLLSQTGLRVSQKLTPFQEKGTRGVPIFGGYVQSQDKNRKWVGREKYVQSSDIVTNISIVAASVHYFLNLLAQPKWSFSPPKGFEKNKKALDLADFMNDVLQDMVTPWPRIVRQAGMYRFHGFCTLEWTAKKRDDGKVGFDNIETRPQHTIERWDVDDLGTINGVWQRSPQTQQLIGIPRNKILYLVEDTLTDSPEGLGLFRHLAEPYDRLRQYLKLEARGFERDLRGTPVGRAPLSLLNKLVQEGSLTEDDAKDAVAELQKLVEAQVKESDTGITLDSAVYESQAADGLKVSGVKQWDLELLSGGTSGLAELARAVDRIQREMARLLGTEQLMMGGESQGGSRALSQDKSRNLYLIANSVLGNIAAGVNSDIVPRIWALNGFPNEMMPRAKTEDVAFKSVEEVTSALSKMAQAGAVLAPDDPVVNDVRDLLGVEHAPEPSKEMLGAHYAPQEQKQQQQEFSQQLRQQDREHVASLQDSTPQVQKQLDEVGAVIFYKYKPDQKRYPKGNPKGGQFAPLTEAESDIFIREGGLLHGTSSEYLDSIKKEGLIPEKGRGADWWLSENQTARYLIMQMRAGNRKSSVFATKDLGFARQFAELAAKNTHADPIILKLKLPPDVYKKAIVDEVGSDMPAQEQNFLRFEQKIKPEWIVGVAKDADGVLVYLVVIPDKLPEEIGLSPIEKGGFDPDQPRDKDGKWTRVLYRGTHPEQELTTPVSSGRFGAGLYLSQQPGVAGRYGSVVTQYESNVPLFDASLRFKSEKELAQLEDAVFAQLTPEEAARVREWWPVGGRIGTRPALVSTGEDVWEVLSRRLGQDRAQQVIRNLGYRGIEGIGDGAETVLFDARDAIRKYDPDQPRDEDGKWSPVGTEARASQDEAAGHLKDFAKMIAAMQRKNSGDRFKTSPAELIAEKGRTYYFDQNSFQGSRDTTHKCFMCATQKVWEDPDLTYVEGYMSVHGVPVEHAWAVNKAGRVIDPTLQDGDGVKGYFGVPIKREYLTQTADRTGYYGVFGHRNRALYGHDPEDIVEKRYNPDQPRYPKGDPKGGQWRPENSEATALYEKTLERDVMPEEFFNRLSPEQRRQISDVEDELAAGTPTNAPVSEGGFKNPDGTWTPERETLHGRILNDMFNPAAVQAATPGANELPTVVFLGGRAGAGKTSAMARVGLPFDQEHFMNVSADLIQEKLPGYTPRLAGLYNQEAQEIATQAEALARQARLNVLYDATMKTPGSALIRLQEYKNAGYRTEAYFVHTSPTVAAARAISRFQKTGRYVPPAYVLSSSTNERTFDLVKSKVDKWALYDNNSPNDPRLVAQGGR